MGIEADYDVAPEVFSFTIRSRLLFHFLSTGVISPALQHNSDDNVLIKSFSNCHLISRSCTL